MRFKTLDEWLQWQSTLHSSEIELNLDRVAKVHRRLALSSSLDSITIVVAGTNGKGSTVAYLEAIALAAGYTTLTYTSPHLQRYTERLRWCGEEISDEAIWVEAFAKVDEARGDDTLTYFEFGTLAAFLIAQQKQPEVTILEVGLGGRLDAVNLINADVAIVTNIELDHCEWLGNSRDLIGVEKAGIARFEKPLIYGGEDLPAVVEEHIHSAGATLLRMGEDYEIIRFEERGEWTLSARETSISKPAEWHLQTPEIPGLHQVENAAAAVMALHLLSDRLTIPETAIQKGMAALLPGRCEMLPGPILRILDVSHNPSAIEQLSDLIRSVSVNGKVIAIFGMMRRKEISSGLRSIANLVQTWILPDCPDNAMYSNAEIADALKKEISSSATIELTDGMEEALKRASVRVAAGDILVVFGSFRMIEWYRKAMECHELPPSQREEVRCDSE